MTYLGRPLRPAWFDEVIADVERAFEVTGTGTPGWPEPPPDFADLLEEEYSRVTDTGKYRILYARVQAWAQALTDSGIADVQDVPADPWIGEVRPPAEHLRVRRFQPARPSGLTLLLATTLVDGEPFGLDIGLDRGRGSPVLLGSVPVCGCDACDLGSTPLLEELDDYFLTVARGGVVHDHWTGTPWSADPKVQLSGT